MTVGEEGEIETTQAKAKCRKSQDLFWGMTYLTKCLTLQREVLKDNTEMQVDTKLKRLEDSLL